MFNLSKVAKIVRLVNATAAGTSDINGTHVDMKGYESVTFIAGFGALTATQVTALKAQQGALADDSDMADLAGTKVGPLADGDSNKLLALEIVRPRERYVRPVVDRGTANAVVDFVIALLYKADKEPVTHDASVAFSELHLSPAEGTA